MRAGQPSQTAFATAYMRAIHVNLDAPPPVLDDRVAFRLLPRYMQRFIWQQKAMNSAFPRRPRVRDPGSKAMRAQIVVRARYAEDCLKDARVQGVRRYVILGAGLDTFALRQPPAGIDVLEIDHPETQRWKRALLARCGITEPEALAYLPVDFERESLTDLWIGGEQPDFISWLGTTYYLSRASVRATLEVLAERTRDGSQLVLDYWDSRPKKLDPLLWGTRIAVALQGEPILSLLEPPQMEKLAQAAGWRVVENASAADQNARYLSCRRDRLSVPSFAHLIRLER